MKKLLVAAAVASAFLSATAALAAPVTYDYVKGSLRSTDPKVTCANDVCKDAQGNEVSSHLGQGTISIDWATLTFTGANGEKSRMSSMGGTAYQLGSTVVVKLSADKIELADCSHGSCDVFNYVAN